MYGEHTTTAWLSFKYFLNPIALIFTAGLLLIIVLLRQQEGSVVKRIGMLFLSLWVIFYLISTPWLHRKMTSLLEEQYSLCGDFPKANPNIHWIVMLGTGPVHGRKAYHDFARLTGTQLKRILQTYRIYKLLPNARILLLGGTEYSERYSGVLPMLDVPEQASVLERFSVETSGLTAEAEAVQRKLKDAPFYLVTSALNMPRAMMMFHQLGMHPHPAPSDFILSRIRSLQKDAFAYQLIPHVDNIVNFSTVLPEYIAYQWLIWETKPRRTRPPSPDKRCEGEY